MKSTVVKYSVCLLIGAVAVHFLGWPFGLLIAAVVAISAYAGPHFRDGMHDAVLDFFGRPD